MAVVLDVALLDDLVPEGEGEVGVVLVHHVGGHDVDGRLQEVNSVEYYTIDFSTTLWSY